MVKRCIVPYCGSNSTLNSNKSFISVPKEDKSRTKWLEAIGTTTNYSKSSTCYCCEDHFVLVNDSENYVKHKYLGDVVKLKGGVVPHKNIPKNVCRLCLKVLTNDVKVILINESVKETIQHCLPEIDLLITKDPVTCEDCFKKIDTFYQLKKLALSTEIKIATQIKNKVKHLSQEEKITFKYDLLRSHKTLTQPEKLKPKKRKLEENNTITIEQIDVKPEEITKFKTEEIKIDCCSNNSNSSSIEEKNNSDSEPAGKQEELQNIDYIATPVALIKQEGAIISLENKKNSTIIYNNEVCDVLYITEGSEEFNNDNMLEFIEGENNSETENVVTNCIFCYEYFGDDLLNHVVVHCGSQVKCNLCDFTSENPSESDLHQHIYVHSNTGSTPES